MESILGLEVILEALHGLRKSVLYQQRKGYVENAPGKTAFTSIPDTTYCLVKSDEKLQLTGILFLCL